MHDVSENHIVEQIAEIENWLIENEDADWKIRYDKISRLTQLKSIIDGNTNEKSSSSDSQRG